MVLALAGLLGLLTVPQAHGLTHYPPSSSSYFNLTWAINGTGAPGIYNSSTTPSGSYGEYNWCAGPTERQMPHVRQQEYKKPNSSYTLAYVEVIQRHNKRTPYASNTFFKEDITWNCTGEGPFANAKDRSVFNTTPVYWQAERNTQNPFEYTVGPGFINSTCQFPGITSAGLEDSLLHGQDFRGVYGDLLQFLPLSNERQKYQWRVTNNVITSQTLSGYAKGIFPDITEYYSLIQSSTYDSLEPTFSCPLASTVDGAYEGTNANWTLHLNASMAVRQRFNNVSGIQPNDTAGWMTSWDHPYDNLSAKQCHQYPLPCSVNNSAICVSQDDANTIYRLGQYEYAYRWRAAPNATLYSALKMGPWFMEMEGHIQAFISGQSSIKYFHNFAHDGSVAPVLGVLQIDQPVWPGMGSEVVFELWQMSGNYFMRVMFGGQPLKTSTPLGTLDMIPLQTFLNYLNDTIPSNIVQLCNSH